MELVAFGVCCLLPLVGPLVPGILFGMWLKKLQEESIGMISDAVDGMASQTNNFRQSAQKIANRTGPMAFFVGVGLVYVFCWALLVMVIIFAIVFGLTGLFVLPNIGR